MIIAIGNDHHGFQHKEMLIKQNGFENIQVDWIDVGSEGPERVDYPPYGQAVARAVQQKKADCGILLCGTGVGMSVVANRFKDIYAALVWTEELARKSKEDDNANILVIPSDYINEKDLLSMINVWLTVDFKGGVYQERLEIIDKLGGV